MPSRRNFLRLTALAALGTAAGRGRAAAPPPERHRTLGVFLAGDVMTGRGIDQILPRPAAPGLHEPWAQSALDYVELAERAHGSIPRSVSPEYIWGDALAELRRAAPDLRIINLETSVTTSDDWQPKGVHYRMHPDNVACLTVAEIDCCVLANNHVLDWGAAGLQQTLATLRRAGIATAGAGGSRLDATTPAALAPSGERVLVWAWGSTSSGIPRDWSADGQRPGVALLPDLSPATAQRIAATIQRNRRPGDVVIVSLHWGGNWGYDVPDEQQRFARTLIAEGDVDIVHGHSSHHPKGIEVFRERPILYGCGDFLNDYEGIRGRERFRGELVLGYLATLDLADRRLAGLEMVPFRIRRFRLERAARDDARWLRRTLDRECRRLGGAVVEGPDGRLALRWS